MQDFFDLIVNIIEALRIGRFMLCMLLALMCIIFIGYKVEDSTLASGLMWLSGIAGFVIGIYWQSQRKQEK